MTIDELVDNFDASEGLEKYGYIISLGETLPPFPDLLRTDGAKVSGCMAQVWLILGWNSEGRLNFLADSDSDIVKGLITILRVVYADKTAAEINNFDIEALFNRLDLDHVTNNRRNGFFSMVQRIKGFTSAPCT